MQRFIAKEVENLIIILDGIRPDMRVEVEPGIPLRATTVADLRNVTKLLSR